MYYIGSLLLSLLFCYSWMQWPVFSDFALQCDFFHAFDQQQKEEVQKRHEYFLLCNLNRHCRPKKSKKFKSRQQAETKPEDEDLSRTFYAMHRLEEPNAAANFALMPPKNGKLDFLLVLDREEAGHKERVGLDYTAIAHRAIVLAHRDRLDQLQCDEYRGQEAVSHLIARLVQRYEEQKREGQCPGHDRLVQLEKLLIKEEDGKVRDFFFSLLHGELGPPLTRFFTLYPVELRKKRINAELPASFQTRFHFADGLLLEAVCGKTAWEKIKRSGFCQEPWTFGKCKRKLVRKEVISSFFPKGGQVFNFSLHLF